MKLKDMLNDKTKVLKFTIIAVGISAAMFLLMLGMTYGTSVPKFCAMCHIMKPEFATWEASSHSQVQCVECHVDPGLTNALKHKVVATKELYRYVTKTYELPIKMAETIPDSRCLKCHSFKRKVSSSSSDLYIPHKRHYDNKVSCTKCHQGVAHGKIASRGMTMGGDFNSWDTATGQKVMTKDNIIPKMDLCMDCHGRRGVTVSCEACHTSSVKPDSHRLASFKLNHGKDAKKNIKYCDTCHAYIKAPGVTSKDLPTEAEDPVAKYLNSFQTGSDSDYTDYAKTNEYCAACHKKRPPSHKETWPFDHGKGIGKPGGQSEQKCLVCHSPRQDVKGTTNQGACSSCHPSIHKSPWRISHPIPIPEKYGLLEPKCFQCHIKDICSSCHGTRNSPSSPVSVSDQVKAPVTPAPAAPNPRVTITPVKQE